MKYKISVHNNVMREILFNPSDGYVIVQAYFSSIEKDLYFFNSRYGNTFISSIDYVYRLI